MEKINSIKQLNDKILLLELHQHQCQLEITESVKKTVSNFSVANFIKKGIASESGNLKSILISTVITLATDYVSKKFLTPGTADPIKRMIGVFLQVGAPNFVFTKNQFFVDQNQSESVQKEDTN